MDTQLGRWSRVTGAVLGGVVLVSAIPVWEMWHAITGNGPAVPDAAWAGLWTLLQWAAGEFAGCLAVLALTRLISGRLLGGRRPLVVGAVLALTAVLVAQQLAYAGATLDDPMGYLYGASQLATTVFVPLVAGAWVLRPVGAGQSRPMPDLSPFTGIWQSAAGVLTLEPDAGFTLRRAGEAVTGSWGLEPEEPRVLALKVAAPTELGHGWQTTALAVEYGPDGGLLLRLDQDHAFTPRPAHATVDQVGLEHAGGYSGRLEILEG
ncbi:hypothetical protein GXW82_36585 [Streptacidiphilus sp. 4-A2]|nr:hypothetical protein [Streptacidiphilus sp. 4-A2]